MEIDCPACHRPADLDGEDLPSRACDSKDFECPECGHEFKIGWHAVPEVRDDCLPR